MNLIFCMLIVIISAAIGRLFSSRMSERLNLIREYQAAFTRLTDSVTGLRIEIIMALQTGSDGRIDALFKSCADELIKNPRLPLHEIWRNRMSRLLKEGLTNDDWQIITEGGLAAEAICANPTEKQAQIYLNRLSAYAAAMEQEKIKKCKLYNTAGVLTGLLIALLVV